MTILTESSVDNILYCYPNQIFDKIFCCYLNRTSQFQIIRISNLSSHFFERAVIPRGHILFETLIEAQIEIHTGTIVSSILSDVISCRQLGDAQSIAVK